ncbi:MAG TPA: class I SAM-dependent methyltransferase, partial [Ktedonobacteraceae bacterium]|nr:class I SAM-dependent methyltransferase [Ktedonobacteraceae bacterium]
ARLLIQDRLVTEGMGGVLPEQEEPSRFQRVLDVGCGTGGWLIQVAKTYPDVERLIGVDISGKMVEYARARARAEGVGNRVEFCVMDTLRMLEFPNEYFHLINHRFGQSYLRTWDWTKLLQEYRRVTQPGGIVRLTEGNSAIESNSPALTQITDLSIQTLHQGGYFFTPTGDGVISRLPTLLTNTNFQNVQTREIVLEYRGGTPQCALFAQDMEHLFRTGEPFLRKWIKLPENYKALCQEASQQMQQSDFLARWHILTAWAVCPDQSGSSAGNYLW